MADTFTLTDDSFTFNIETLIRKGIFYYDSSIDEVNQISADNINNNDTNGYTPLCYAVLNNIDQKYILALLRVNNIDLNLECDHGKTPIQYACLSMNADAIKILLGDNTYSITEQTVNDNDSDMIDVISFNIATTDADNIASVSTTHTAYFSSVDDDHIIYSEDNYYSDPYEYTLATVSINDLLAAAVLPKSDILEALKSSIDENNINKTDTYNNSLLMLTCISQCYQSVDTILNITDTDDNPIVPDLTILNTNGDWAYSIAENLGDTGIMNKLLSAINTYSEQYLYQFNNILTDDDLSTSDENELSVFAKFIIDNYDDNSTTWLTTILQNNYYKLVKLLINFGKLAITSSDLSAENIEDLSSTAKAIVNNYTFTSLVNIINLSCSDIITLLNNFNKIIPTSDDLTASSEDDLSDTAIDILNNYYDSCLDTLTPLDNYSNIISILYKFDKINPSSSDLEASNIEDLSTTSKYIVTNYNSAWLVNIINCACYNIITLLYNFDKFSDVFTIKTAVLNGDLVSMYLPPELRPIAT